MKECLYQFDVLVVGVGLAGERAANEAHRRGARVGIVGKSLRTASTEVMGFNIPVRPEDSVESYYADLLRSGEGINAKELARTLAGESLAEVPYLESLGFVFDKCEDGTYHAQFPIGSSHPRLIHQKAISGIKALELIRSDNQRRGVVKHLNVMIVDLVKVDGCVTGAVGLDLKTGQVLLYRANAVVIASGGLGRMHPVSTYPQGAVGDGYAMAYRAGAELVDMEFLQYDPCCLVWPRQVMGAPIATTMLMKGAQLLNGQGEPFLERYGSNPNHLQKGTLSRAMAAEIAAGRGTEHGGVLYDLRMLSEYTVKVEHSVFYDPPKAAGFDIWEQPAEVAPAAHSCLGGIRINAGGRSTVPGLYACGEAAGGVHGANRIGGSAGTEILTFGALAGRHAAGWALEEDGPDQGAFERAAAAVKAGHTLAPREGGGVTVEELTGQLGQLVHTKVGILRCQAELDQAKRDLDAIEGRLAEARVGDTADAAALCQLENMLLNARMQVICSLSRMESRGVFYRTDYPRRDDAWLKNQIVSREGNTMTVKTVPCL